MPLWRELPPEVQEAHQRIHKAIERESSIIGPDSEWWKNQISGSDEEPPKEGTILSEWVLICAEVELDTGDVWRSLYHSPRLPKHHVQGLLHTYAE